MAKTVTFNEELWKRGMFYHCQVTEEIGLCTSLNTNVTSYYFSVSLDSMETGTNWHKAVIHCPVPFDGIFIFTYFARDTDFIINDGKPLFLNQFVKSQEYSAKEKKDLFEELSDGRVVSPRDVLLNKAVGRYLWFFFEMEAGYKYYINRLTFRFSVQSYTQLLPECFQESKEGENFLHRFLSVFQTMYDTIQEEINNISKYFDPNLIEENDLSWLADWVGCPQITEESKQIQRKWIQNSFSLIQKKGTVEGLSRLLTLVTGVRPAIIETYQIMDFYSPIVYEEVYKNLYGKDVYSFLVLFKEGDLNLDGSLKEERLEQIRDCISYYKPAYTHSELVILRPYLILGQHCYLGINSTVSTASILLLNNMTILPFQTVLSDK